MRNLYAVFLILISSFSFSQTKVKDTITRSANIGYDKKGNRVTFKPETPPLVQIAGAPKANYTYLWEMGDGSYSKEENPKHVYKKKGDYKVNLTVTNNYDIGKPPKTRPKVVAINDISEPNFDEIASLSDVEGFTIFNNREPLPEEEMVLVVSYQNKLDYVANGKLYLFYNDKEFKKKNFDLIETRTHFGEKEVSENGIASVEGKNNSFQNIASECSFPCFSNSFSTDEQNLDLTLAESKALFSDSKILEFDGMNPNETRNVFFTLKTTPEMIKDTSATVKIRGVYVPDRNYKNHKKKTLEMEIVTSHDPNKMSSNATYINYRTVKFKDINFKTRFQNNGKGPARMIRLETDIPDMFDKKTLKIVDSYPQCPICPKDKEVNYSCLDTLIKEKQIHFTFKNIYIPGSNQKNVKEVDSTKGYVRYSMKLAKDFHKKSTRSKTSIIFDANEPVITNYAVTRFKPGISIGAKTGYNLFSGLKGAKSYFVGATVCPYKSYRWYWQSEIYYNHFQNDQDEVQGELVLKQFTPPINNNGTPIDGAFVQTSSTSKINKNIIDIVPISLRYNINNYIGLGLGPQISYSLTDKKETVETTKYYEAIFGPTSTMQGPEYDFLRTEKFVGTVDSSSKKTQASVFGDVTFGFARIGPSVGIRYYKNFEKDYDYWQFYAIWKF